MVVLNRTGCLEQPKGVSDDEWRDELLFYNILEKPKDDPGNGKKSMRPERSRWRAALYDFLEGTQFTRFTGTIVQILTPVCRLSPVTKNPPRRR